MSTHMGKREVTCKVCSRQFLVTGEALRKFSLYFCSVECYEKWHDTLCKVLRDKIFQMAKKGR